MTPQIRCRQSLVVALVTIIAFSLVPGGAIAQSGASEEEGDDSGDTIIDIDLDSVVDAIDDLLDELTEFTGNWDDTLKDILIGVFFAPFKRLAQVLVRSLALVMLNTPTVHPNPAVAAVHSRVLLVTYLLSTLAFAGAGLLYMVGPIVGVSYSDARMILPRIVAALAFATVSPQLLQFAVELSDALVYAFQPQGLTMKFTELAGLSTALVLVWVIDAFLLLVLLLMFLFRATYLLFVTAASPIIALAWAFPKTKRYADTFIAGFWTAWAMAPLDMLVLRFNLELMTGAGATGLQSLSNWMFGVAGFSLMILVPYQLYGASQAAVGQAYLFTRGVKKRTAPAREHVKNRVRQRLRGQDKQEWDRLPTSSSGDRYWGDD